MNSYWTNAPTLRRNEFAASLDKFDNLFGIMIIPVQWHVLSAHLPLFHFKLPQERFQIWNIPDRLLLLHVLQVWQMAGHEVPGHHIIGSR